MNIQTLNSMTVDVDRLNGSQDGLLRCDLEPKPRRSNGVRIAAESITSQLEDSLRQSLLDSAYSELDQLAVSVREGKLHLSGKVSSYFLKQVAQATLLSLCRLPLINNVEVVYAIERKNS